MPIAGHQLRDTLRHVPTPVTVVTAREADGSPRGVTIGSFMGVSLDPPLVAVYVNRDAQMRDVLATNEVYAIHVLREDQAALSEHFAVPDLASAEQFAGVSFHDEGGLPVLDEALAVMHCRRQEVYEAGTHSVFVGRVERLDEHGGMPLLYYKSAYFEVGSEVTSMALDPVKRASSDTS